VEHPDDVRAVEGPRRARLAAEAARGVAAGPEQAALDQLDGDALARIDALRLVDGAHPAGPEDADEAMPSSDDRASVEESARDPVVDAGEGRLDLRGLQRVEDGAAGGARLGVALDLRGGAAGEPPLA